jgi:hypothetical protein
MSNELEAIYGPAAAFSEHKRGDMITYLEDGIEHAGEIPWVCAPGNITGTDLPTRYIVEREDGGFPAIVWPSDVLMSK